MFDQIYNCKVNLIDRFNVERTIGPNSKIELIPSAIPKKTGKDDRLSKFHRENVFTVEVTYKTLVQTGALQEEGDHSNLTIAISGKNGQTKAMPLDETSKMNKKTSFKREEKSEFEFKTHDVGKVRSL